MELRDDPDNHRYVAEVEGTVAGYTVYHHRGGRYFLVHTEVDESYEGRGIGSALATYALDDVRAKGAKVVALCPFIAGYIQRHDEYAELIDRDMTACIDTADSS